MVASMLSYGTGNEPMRFFCLICFPKLQEANASGRGELGATKREIFIMLDEQVIQIDNDR